MKSLQGQILVASPQLVDPNFFRAVVLIVQHSDEGALGLVLNRPLEPTIEMVWDQILSEEERDAGETPCLVEGHLHRGGPCDGPLMVVHNDENHSQIEVTAGVHFSTEKDAVEDLVTRGDEDLKIKFFLGYAGWSPGQLEHELAEGSWLTIAATPDQIFLSGDDDGEEQWTALRREIARVTTFPWIDPKRIPPDPTVN